MGSSRILILYASVTFALVTPAISRFYPDLLGLKIAGGVCQLAFLHFGLWGNGPPFGS